MIYELPRYEANIRASAQEFTILIASLILISTNLTYLLSQLTWTLLYKSSDSMSFPDGQRAARGILIALISLNQLLLYYIINAFKIVCECTMRTPNNCDWKVVGIP